MISTYAVVGIGLVQLLLVLQLADAQEGGCSSITVRRDIASLSPQEWNRMANVLTRMQADGWFTRFAEIHDREFDNVHGNDNFYPFHRLFIRDFEEVGQTYDPSFAIPYWDELRDSRNPAASGVFSSRLLGGNGFGSCVRDGLQSGWTMPFPNSHCLIRQFDRGNYIQPWYSPEYIYSIMQRYGDMHMFRVNIEYSIHDSVHLSIGGDMATHWSANDFIFYLHHANMDRLWDQWQSWGHAMTMDGYNQNGIPMSLNQPLPHYGDSVGSTMRRGVGRMCFAYSGSGGAHSATDALSMVSTPLRGELESANAGLSKLPRHVLEKWFPVLARTIRPKSSANVNATTPVSNSGAVVPDNSTDSITISAKNRLPYPAPLTEMWISMHKYDRKVVADLMSEARQFVDDLNNANYDSPY
ncbi:hypothetical protein EV175_003949 [Coemansia sp. RSA 1933]|nr:hypothetical protein EV175_003949 [Coemansia sp. RSA 1933]